MWHIKIERGLDGSLAICSSREDPETRSEWLPYMLCATNSHNHAIESIALIAALQSEFLDICLLVLSSALILTIQQYFMAEYTSKLRIFADLGETTNMLI